MLPGYTISHATTQRCFLQIQMIFHIWWLRLGSFNFPMMQSRHPGSLGLDGFPRPAICAGRLDAGQGQGPRLPGSRAIAGRRHRDSAVCWGVLNTMHYQKVTHGRPRSASTPTASSTRPDTPSRHQKSIQPRLQADGKDTVCRKPHQQNPT